MMILERSLKNTQLIQMIWLISGVLTRLTSNSTSMRLLWQ